MIVMDSLPEETLWKSINDVKHWAVDNEYNFEVKDGYLIVRPSNGVVLRFRELKEGEQFVPLEK